MAKRTKRNILYYPTINIPTNNWLRHALLYWDEVSSIVPQSWDDKYLYHLSDDLYYLMDNEEFRAIRPDNLLNTPNWEILEQFQSEFMDIINSKEFNRQIFSPNSYSEIHRSKAIPKLTAEIHENKTSHNLFEFLREKGLAKRDNDSDWLLFERRTALIYMSLLAKYLADIDKNPTTISTDLSIYEKFNFRKVKEDKGFPVVSISLSNLLPIPTANTPLRDIIDFKRRRKDNLLHFRKILMDFQIKVGNAETNTELKELTIAFQENIEVGVNDLTKLMKDSNLDIFLKSIKSMVNIKSATPYLAVGAAVNDKLQAVSVSQPIAMGIVGMVGMIELGSTYIEARNKKRVALRDSPFSYLYSARKAGIFVK